MQGLVHSLTVAEGDRDLHEINEKNAKKQDAAHRMSTGCG
jgi:hypothetical protein